MGVGEGLGMLELLRFRTVDRIPRFCLKIDAMRGSERAILCTDSSYNVLRF